VKGWIGSRRYAPAPMSERGKARELALVKLRYKLPDGQTSRLIERVLPASLLATTARPSGDFAFATAVAAFGQTLRGDSMMNGFGYPQIAALAGRPQDAWRQEVGEL